MVDEANRNAVLVEVPLVLDLPREHAGRLDAAQRAVLPVARMRHELGDRAHRGATRPRDRQPVLLDAKMEAWLVAHVLKMLEVPRDLEVERLRARSLGELLRDRRGRRARCPRRYFADRLRETNDCVRLKLVGPPSEHVVWCYAYQLTAKALPVRQPRVAEGELRQRA